MPKLFTPEKIEVISQLRPEIQQLRERYPFTFAEYAETVLAGQTDPFPPGHQFEQFAVYYGDTARRPGYLFMDGKATIDFVEPGDTGVIQARGNWDWVYFQVEGYVLLNRIEQAALPQMPTLDELANMVAAATE